MARQWDGCVEVKQRDRNHDLFDGREGTDDTIKLQL